MSAYRIESTELENPLFKVDAAYVIHLEGNGRLDSVREQLAKNPVAALVHIVHNKGYKKTGKKLPKQSPSHDLVDAYKYVFADAEGKGYGNILVLEDDFFFREDLTAADVAEVNKFVRNNSNRRMVYHLGCIPALMVPVDTRGNYMIAGSSTHAAVYTKKMRKYVLNYKGVIDDWDWFITFATPRFAYTRPLAYQLYPETENSNNWMTLLGITYLVKIWIRILKLDVQPEPGYSICYFVAKSMFYLGCILFLVFAWALYNYEQTIELLKLLFQKAKTNIYEPLFAPRA